MFKSLVLALVLIGSQSQAGEVRAMRAPKAPPTYLVEGKTVSATEAILAYLNGKTPKKCQDMEVQDSTNGPKLVPAKK